MKYFYLIAALLVLGLVAKLVMLEQERPKSIPVSVHTSEETKPSSLQVTVDINRQMTGLECPEHWLGGDLKISSIAPPGASNAATAPSLMCYYTGLTSVDECKKEGGETKFDDKDGLCRKVDGNQRLTLSILMPR